MCFFATCWGIVVKGRVCVVVGGEGVGGSGSGGDGHL